MNNTIPTSNIADLPVIFSEMQSFTNHLSKKFDYVDGKIKKTAAAQMIDGLVHIRDIDFSELPAILDKKDTKHALCLGIPKNGADKLHICTQKAKRNKFKDDGHYITRSLDYLKFPDGPGLLMIDHDPSEYGTTLKPDELINIIDDICPVFKKAAHIIRGSVSAGVHKKGEKQKPGKGFHIYIPVKNAPDIPRFNKALLGWLWLKGHGFIALAKNGAMLVRSPIDGAVASSERLDFIAPPIWDEEQLEYSAPEIIYEPGDYLDTSILQFGEEETSEVARLIEEAKAPMRERGLTMLDSWAKQQVIQRMENKVPMDKAEKDVARMVDSIKTGKHYDIDGGYELHFASGEVVTVNEALKNWQQYDGEELADPIEGPEYGTTTAKFYFNKGDKPVISSFAHGGQKYFLHRSEERPKFQLMLAGDLTEEPAPENWLVKGFMGKSELGLLWGEPASGKSLLILDIGFCMASGLDWEGHKTEQGDVVIVAGEGYLGYKKRLKALENKYVRRAPMRLAISKQSAQLDSAESCDEVARAIIDAKLNPKLIVIDTLNRNFCADENSSHDIAQLMTNIEQYFKSFGATVIIVHHSGHTTENRSRGSSAIRAAIDFEYKVTKKENDVGVANFKAKDFEPPKPLSFVLKSTQLDWFGEDGEPQTSVYLEYTVEEIKTKKKTKLSPEDDQILQSLTDALREKGFAPPAEILKKFSITGTGTFAHVVTVDDWRPYAYKAMLIDDESKDPSGLRRKRFARFQKSHLGTHFMIHDGYVWRLSDNKYEDTDDSVFEISVNGKKIFSCLVDDEAA